MSEENTATNPKKSAVDERVDKLEAAMQTVAATLQTISLTLSTLTTGSIPSTAYLVPSTPAPPVPIPPSIITSGIQTNFKFKQPDFDKYDDSGCPYAHLQMYARKMTAYANHERALIHYFQDSLSGPASIWFSILNKKKIRTFKDVSQAFMKQYEYNINLAPTRDNLQRVTKKVTAGEQIEDGLKTGLIMDFQAIQKQLEQVKMGSAGSTSKKFAPGGKKEDEEAFSHISTCHTKPVYNVAKISYNRQPQLQYTSAFKPTTYPFWYDPQARCEYHNVVGHGTEYCATLRHKIQDLIDKGKLQLDTKEAESTPNITRNPLPPRDASTMNMVALDEVALDEVEKPFKEVAVDDITDEVCFDDEEDYFGFNNLFGPANMIDSKERWRRMLAEKASMEKHPSFHLVHHAKAPMGSHESMLLGTREEESLCDSLRNLTINALDEEELEFDKGVSLVNGSF
ncbi:hypothetical protein SLEP1_g55589 [Rubroshorea leprosula]|uniref:Retrotransposon gag domain-containing protein n=1 Tax=Rubroshorea leprosula TaxID=152421 RepID=A0AAV5MH05_9ROSI|nr:hypothetical protein SLEP1_g55589 [Rubroshorea leprosula]